MKKVYFLFVISIMLSIVIGFLLSEKMSVTPEQPEISAKKPEELKKEPEEIKEYVTKKTIPEESKKPENFESWSKHWEIMRH